MGSSRKRSPATRKSICNRRAWLIYEDEEHAKRKTGKMASDINAEKRQKTEKTLQTAV